MVAGQLQEQKECDEVAKPEWWNDEGLKALSARVVRAAPNCVQTNEMRGLVLSGRSDFWEAGPRSAAELKKAAARYDRAASVCDAVAQKAGLARTADAARQK